MKHIKHWLATIAVLLCSMGVSAATYSDWVSTNEGQSSTTSSNTYTITANAGDVLTFDWFVSSESNYDKLIITIGGTEILNKSGELSGTYQHTFTSSGTYTMVVKYTKDVSIDEGRDYAMVYNITLGTGGAGGSGDSGTDNIIAFGTCGDNLTWKLTDEGELRIEGTGEMTSSPWKTDYKYKIKTVKIEEGVTSIGNDAFNGCYELTSITLPESVTSIGSYAFWGCNKLTTITIPENSQLTSIGNEAFTGCYCLTSITLPEKLTSIGQRAFYNCNSLTSITLPESVKSIGDYAFVGCVGLTAITIPESMTSIGNFVFSGCTGLTSITLPESVTSIGNYAFNGCNSLTSITLPKSVKSIGDYAFDCSKLYKVINYSNLPLSAGSKDYGCVAYNAKKVYQGDWLATVDDFQFYTTNDIHYLVNYIGNDTEIVLPNNYNGESYQIGDYAFCYYSLTAITLPESVTGIGLYAFFACSSLETITLPEGVTSIGKSAFSNCTNLTAITIPEGVTSIRYNAFFGCSNLTDVYCYAEEVPKTDTYAFEYSNIENATLHVPANALETYESTAPWSSFGKFEILTPRSITITMNQYGSGTYCSPYALDFSEVEGLKAYAATGYDSETGIVTLTRVMTSQPGMGLFIKGEPGEYIVPTLESTSFNTLNMLVGTLENTDLNGISADGLYANYKYTVKEGDAEPVFYQFADGSTLAAGRAYLQIPTAWLTSATAKSISYRFDDGETTDIEDIESGIQNSELIYDLMGRRVQTPSKGSVYIVNGKKIVY